MEGKKLLLLVLFVWSAGILLGQQATLMGIITDELNEPAIGATVLLEGTMTGTATDLDGRYSLKVDPGTYSMVYSYVGYLTQEKEVTLSAGQTLQINIQLVEDAVLLDQVVVVGYGTQRKRDLVGSVASIGSDELNDNIGGSLENSLQGKAPGIQLTQSSGIAGAGSIVRIRGVGSLSSGGDPLYVVDGIPITQDNFLNGETGGVNNNPLSSINPNDIESIEVLKDAAAAAIYGSRGSNGVILITTKRGKSTKPEFEFSTRFGISKPTNMVEFLNADEWLQVRQEAWENDGNTGRAPLPLNLTYEDIEGIDTDWFDQVLQTGFKHEYNLSMKQGNEKVSTYAGISYSSSESYQIGNKFDRLSGRINVDYNLTDNFRISLSTSLSRGLNFRIPQAWAGGMGLAQTSALPIYPILNENGDYFNLYSNPVAQRELTTWRTRELRSINNIALNYAPVKGLSINAVGNYDYMNVGDYFVEDSIWTTIGTISKGYKSKVNNWSTYGTATYDIPIKNDDHSLAIMGGVEYQQADNFKTNEEYLNLEDFLYQNPSLGENIDTLRFDEEEVDKWKFFSYFSRVNYSWRGKWLAQATFRRDGSSKFGSNNRFGNFPSLGIGYIMSEEPFLKDNDVISYLKFKVSWGITGNADIDWKEQFPIYYPDNVGGVDNSPGYNSDPLKNQIKLENPDLQWEVTNTYDAGFELGLLQDRITTDFTFYYQRTTDAIINIAIQSSSGIDNLVFPENVGEIENYGVELGFKSRNLVGDFKWSTELNVGLNRNEVLDVGQATADALDGGFGDTRAIPGEEVSTNYIISFSHVDPATGRPVYFDLDGNETFDYNVANRQSNGGPNPDFFGGITNTFSFKGFDLSFLFTFSYGGQIYDDAAKRTMGVVTDWNMRKEIFDRWQEPGDIAAFPQLTMSMLNWGGNANFWQNNHSLWLYDADYLRLKTLNFGYTFLPKGDKSFYESIRVYIQGSNLLTFTNYDGWDPEVARGRENSQQRNIGGTGVTYLTPPQEKAFTVGLNVKF